MGEFSGGSGAKAWGSVCDTCPKRARQVVGLCDKEGCERFDSYYDDNRQKLYFQMDCSHCKQWVSVFPIEGAKCANCGLDSTKAHQAHVASGESRAIVALGGPILDDMGPKVAEDYLDDD